MEILSYQFSAGQPATQRVHVGVVGSGDLEILLEPHIPGNSIITVTTSVDGMANTWQALLHRIFTRTADLPAVRLEINDFGATPGVVKLRIEQAFDMI